MTGPTNDERLALEALASAILGAADILDCVSAVRAIAESGELPAAHVQYLADMIELCPMHLVDAEICADDQVDECEAVRQGNADLPAGWNFRTGRDTVPLAVLMSPERAQVIGERTAQYPNLAYLTDGAIVDLDVEALSYCDDKLAAIEAAVVDLHGGLTWDDIQWALDQIVNEQIEAGA